MKYVSTRGMTEVCSLDAIVNGIGENGGLYIPKEFPEKLNLEELETLNYNKLAYKILSKFLPELEDELEEYIEKSYSKFEVSEVVKLKNFDKFSFMELYHGPTYAFKDVALSIMPYLLKGAMKKLKREENILILTATSGDTGIAAMEGFKNIDGIKVMVIYPEDGVSHIQKYQMITKEGNNLNVISLKGNFDDAQSAVKSIFTNEKMKSELKNKNYIFSSANSINIGRLLPQIVYYFYSYFTLIKNGKIKKGEKINFAVPTGNFGDILAGYFAKKLGLPINKLICASNENNILTDFLNTGIYDINRRFVNTNSPSMDILISSNLERLLYYANNEKCESVVSLMNNLKSKGKYEMENDSMENLNDFYGNYINMEETLKCIKSVFENYDYLIDTHTAVSFGVYEKYVREVNDDSYTVILSTASPYKFSDSILEALGLKASGDIYSDFETLEKETNEKMPNGLYKLKDSEIRFNKVVTRDEIQDEILKFIEA